MCHHYEHTSLDPLQDPPIPAVQDSFLSALGGIRYRAPKAMTPCQHTCVTHVCVPYAHIYVPNNVVVFWWRKEKKNNNNNNTERLANRLMLLRLGDPSSLPEMEGRGFQNSVYDVFHPLKYKCRHIFVKHLHFTGKPSLPLSDRKRFVFMFGPAILPLNSRGVLQTCRGLFVNGVLLMNIYGFLLFGPTRVDFLRAGFSASSCVILKDDVNTGHFALSLISALMQVP